jgi:hypothetical protein
MRLRDLNPTLVGAVDRGKLYFDCPHPGCTHTICVLISSAPYHERPSDHPGQKPSKVWQASGVFPDTLTLAPSIDLTEEDENGKKIRTVCWHGHIRNGEIT